MTDDMVSLRNLIKEKEEQITKIEAEYAEKEAAVATEIDTAYGGKITTAEKKYKDAENRLALSQKTLSSVKTEFLKLKQIFRETGAGADKVESFKAKLEDAKVVVLSNKENFKIYKGVYTKFINERNKLLKTETKSTISEKNQSIKAVQKEIKACEKQISKLEKEAKKSLF